MDYVRKRHKNSNDKSWHHQEKYKGYLLLQTMLPMRSPHPRPRARPAAHPPEDLARCRRPPGGDFIPTAVQEATGEAEVPPPPPARPAAPPHLSPAVPQPLLGAGEAAFRLHPRLHVPHSRGRRQLEGPAAQAVMEDGHPGQPATDNTTDTS